MKKIHFVLFVLIISFLTACDDKGSDDPIPPSPPAVKPTEDGLLGTWETYYYEKQITVNPGGSGGQESVFQGLRYIDYDGFRSSYKKVNGKYIAEDYNLAGNLVFEADFHVKGDTIIYARTVKTKDDRDSIVYSWQRVREFNPEKGILTVDQSYDGTSKLDNVKYRITDIKIARNVETAPTTTAGVTKHIIDYENLCKGKWEIYLFKEWEGGKLKEAYSEEQTKILRGTSFEFFVNDKGAKRCIMTEWDEKNNKFRSTDYPVLLIDDVVHLLYQTPVLDEDNNKVLDEDGNIVLEDASIFLWITDWDQREGTDSFIDYKKSRYSENVRITVETHIFLKRILD